MESFSFYVYVCVIIELFEEMSQSLIQFWKGTAHQIMLISAGYTHIRF